MKHVLATGLPKKRNNVSLNVFYCPLCFLLQEAAVSASLSGGRSRRNTKYSSVLKSDIVEGA